MYLNKLEIRDDTYTLMSASYFDLYLPINEEDDWDPYCMTNEMTFQL